MLRAAKRARTLLSPALPSLEQLGAHRAATVKSRGGTGLQEWQWLQEKGVQLNPCNSP